MFLLVPMLLFFKKNWKYSHKWINFIEKEMSEIIQFRMHFSFASRLLMEFRWVSSTNGQYMVMFVVTSTDNVRIKVSLKLNAEIFYGISNWNLPDVEKLRFNVYNKWLFPYPKSTSKIENLMTRLSRTHFKGIELQSVSTEIDFSSGAHNNAMSCRNISVLNNCKRRAMEKINSIRKAVWWIIVEKWQKFHEVSSNARQSWLGFLRTPSTIEECKDTEKTHLQQKNNGRFELYDILYTAILNLLNFRKPLDILNFQR